MKNILIRTPSVFFVEVEKNEPKIDKRSQRTQNSKEWEYTLPNFIMYYKVTVIKIVW